MENVALVMTYSMAIKMVVIFVAVAAPTVFMLNLIGK